MADRRRRHRRKRAGTAGCLCALALFAGAGALAAYALPWAQAELGGMLKIIAGKEAEETVNAVSEQGADFPELTVTVEEVEGDFYLSAAHGRGADRIQGTAPGGTGDGGMHPAPCRQGGSSRKSIRVSAVRPGGIILV